MQIFFYIYLFFIAVWFLGVIAAGYHVFRYRAPNDAVLISFWVFLLIALAAFLWSVWTVSGAAWGGTV